MNDIDVKIPIELTAAMIVRAGVIKDEARAGELAVELHDIVARCVELFRADKRRLCGSPSDTPAARISTRCCVLIDVFFLCIVNARNGLDRFDDPLPIAQRHGVCVALGETVG